MAVVARMRLQAVTSFGNYGAQVKLQAVKVADDPHDEEISRFFAATPSGSLELNISNAAAAEHFQFNASEPTDFYVTLEAVPKS